MLTTSDRMKENVKPLNVGPKVKVEVFGGKNFDGVENELKILERRASASSDAL